ncbi:regulatory protein RecX [Emticicia sp. C21]|uniref:regulatory protein RecX n=1 Tax=Emticicia sp. C21 TaxID=2302915 RepID=UPI000E3474FA|nr:regulatory protein RecX [Emticicia sp. C21]RFS15564.1 RecX family transcriptional regulator [Emticicia sp. C21]
MIIRKDALVKAANFCAYQERTQAEVREKLQKLGVDGDEADEIIVYLIEENYLNEGRFAKIFAGSKFRVKHWGRTKILYELKARKLSEHSIREGLAEIDDEDYIETLRTLIEKKKRELRSEKQPLVLKQKLARYAISKGFEGDLVWDIINKPEK